MKNKQDYGKVMGDVIIASHGIAEITGQDPKEIYNPIITKLPGVTPYKRDPINMGEWAKNR
jgi:hypothetical protein